MDATVLVRDIFGHPMVRVVATLLLCNVVSGIAVAFYKRSFALGAMADWLMSRALPYLLGSAVVQMMLMGLPAEWSGITSAVSGGVWLFVSGALVGKILENLAEMGLPVPRMLTDKPKPEVTATP